MKMKKNSKIFPNQQNMHYLKGLVEIPWFPVFFFFLLPAAVTEIHHAGFYRLCAICQARLVLLNCMAIEEESGPLCEPDSFWLSER